MLKLPIQWTYIEIPTHSSLVTMEEYQIVRVLQNERLLPLLFILVMNWIMKKTTKKGPKGISWTLTYHLEDLDFVDDFCLLSSKKC